MRYYRIHFNFALAEDTMNKTVLFESEDYVEDELPKIFNKTKKELSEDVKMLQEWMKTQPHLPEIMDFAQLRQILINNKCSIEITKKKIDMLYTLKSKLPDLFEYVNPIKIPLLKKLLDDYIIVIAALPKLTNDMHRIVIVSLNNSEWLHKNSFHHFRYLILSLTEVFLTESYHWKFILIVDLSKCTFEGGKNYLALLPLPLHKLLLFNEHTVKFRFEAIYVINAPSFINFVTEILKKLIKPKLFQRIHFCDEEFIRNRFPKKILPDNYGGEGESLEKLHDLLKLKFSEHQDRFEQMYRMEVNENLRPQKLENDDFLGFYGNFKNLELD